MDWIKRHKLWSLSILYFGVGFGVAVVGELLGVLNSLGVGELIGVCFWAYLFVCFIVLKIVEKKQGSKEDEKV